MKSNYISLSVFEYEQYREKWYKASSDTKILNKITAPLTIVQWCRTEIEGQWTGHLDEMWFEKKEDQVKFVLSWG